MSNLKRNNASPLVSAKKRTRKDISHGRTAKTDLGMQVDDSMRPKSRYASAGGSDSSRRALQMKQELEDVKRMQGKSQSETVMTIPAQITAFDIVQSVCQNIDYARTVVDGILANNRGLYDEIYGRDQTAQIVAKFGYFENRDRFHMGSSHTLDLPPNERKVERLQLKPKPTLERKEQTLLQKIKEPPRTSDDPEKLPQPVGSFTLDLSPAAIAKWGHHFRGLAPENIRLALKFNLKADAVTQEGQKKNIMLAFAARLLNYGYHKARYERTKTPYEVKDLLLATTGIKSWNSIKLFRPLFLHACQGWTGYKTTINKAKNPRSLWLEKEGRTVCRDKIKKKLKGRKGAKANKLTPAEVFFHATFPNFKQFNADLWPVVVKDE